MVGVKPNLTERQTETLKGLREKKDSGKITDKQLVTLGSLIEKKNQPLKLSGTATSYCNEIIQETIMGRSKSITSKYLEKGIAVEEYSFNELSNKLDLFLVKNEKRFSNEYVVGTPDNIEGKIRDVKSSWDYSTFPLFDKECKVGSIYYWQMMLYMWLTGLESAELAYCLVDTPDNLVNDEIRKLGWKIGALSTDSIPTPLIVETVQNMIYTEKGIKAYCHQSSEVQLDWFTDFREIPREHRIKIFEIEYDPAAIEKFKVYADLARDYMTDAMIAMVAELEGVDPLTAQLEASIETMVK